MARVKDHGAYLGDGEGQEVLLPRRYLTADTKEGQEIDVFVYTDSEDRPVATTEHPLAAVGQIAMMTVKADSRQGAFMDWGLAKDLLVPFNEQRFRLRRGMKLPIYVYLDHASMRPVGSACIERYLGNVLPQYTPGQKVEAFVLEVNERGYRCAVDSLHHGMLYAGDVHRPLAVGDRLEAWVTKVRPDGKIDLSPADTSARHRKAALTDRILEVLRVNGGRLALGDQSSPDEIRALLGCSKRDFKQALGALYRDHRVVLYPALTELVQGERTK